MIHHFHRRPVALLSLLALLAVAGCHQAVQQAQLPTRSTSTSSHRSRRTRSRGSSSSGRSYQSSQSSGSFPSIGSSGEGNLLLGNPSGAATDANNYLLAKPQYSLSYNRRNGGPNWVSWHTDSTDLGSTKRGEFHPDSALPAEWQITPTDYKSSGYDRGHICPSGDRTSSRDNNDATFCMSNMVPQTAELNRHVWETLEVYLRDQVSDGNEVYEIAGPAGNSGTIAGGAVVVPKLCWKIAVILPEGTGDLSRINAMTRVIAVAMPNITDKKLETADWRTYLVTPRQIEGATHLDFFTGLPAQIKSALDQKIDSGN